MIRSLFRSILPRPWHPGAIADRALKNLESDLLVQSGPFRGMRYIAEAHGSAHIPKLVGCYEQELHPWIASLADRPFNTIVDAGAAEGYYAVGLAKLFPSAAVVAFELEQRAQDLLVKLAVANSVDDRIVVRSSFDLESVAALDLHQSLLVLDIEGAELPILSQVDTGQMAECTILFEAHHARDLIREKILSRFEDTHRISRTSSAPRSYTDIPLPNPIKRWWIRKVVGDWTNEGRPVTQDWYLLEPVNRQSNQSR